MDSRALILQCNLCKKLYRISKARWNNLLKKWGTPNNVVDHYLCKHCDVVLPVSPGVTKDNIFTEHASPEEQAALELTVDGHRFNKDAVLQLLDNISIYKRIVSRTKVSPKIKTVSENELKEFEQMYIKFLLEKEQQEKNK